MSEPAAPSPSVLFVANDPAGHATWRYRSEHLAAVLRDAGWDAEVVYVGQPRVRVRHDVVVLHRICANRDGRAFGGAARAAGSVLAYSCDDLVFDPEAFPTDGTRLDQRFRRFAGLHREMARSADALIVSTDDLAAHAARCAPGRPVHVLRNFLGRGLLDASSAAARRTEPPDPPTLAYLSGSATHDRDLASIAAPLRAVMKARPDVRLLLVGPVSLPDVLAPLAGRVDRLPFVAWRDLPALMARRVTVNLAPLDLSSPFNHAKSEIKWLEAATVGVPTLASDGAGFAEFLRPLPGAARFLAAGEEQWRERLLALLGDPAAAGAEAARLLEQGGGTEAAWRDRVTDVFARLRALRSGTARVSHVNWPTSPPKYLIKAALRARNARPSAV
jgi:glycosyltransferase involved in cell wall biosynthesis